MGLEPTVSGATNRRFNQLSYIHRDVQVIIPQSRCLSRYFSLKKSEIRLTKADFAGIPIFASLLNETVSE